MELFEKGRKRKRGNRPQSSLRSLIVSSCFFVLLLFFYSGWFSISPIKITPFRPVLRTRALSLLSADSIQHSSHGRSMPLRVEDRIQFPDYLLLILSDITESSEKLDCVYHRLVAGSDGYATQGDFFTKPAISVNGYNGFRSFVRCPNPPANYSAAIDLKKLGEEAKDRGDWLPSVSNQTVQSWAKLAYEAALDGETAVVFVKGLNLRPHKESDPSYFRCQFGIGNWEKDEGFAFLTEALSAAQELVRCALPRGLRKFPEKAHGIRVTVVRVDPRARALPGNRGQTMPYIGEVQNSGLKQQRTRRDRYGEPVALPSVARIYSYDSDSHRRKRRTQEKYDLCACTMLWNQASFLREWITYHAWLGVERWFIYDNNSDDGIQEIVEELEQQNYNVSRHSWPWIKTQEAGFSHCALRAREECKWVGFFDVDEFYYFPRVHKLDSQGQNALRSLVANFSSSSDVAEIRTTCHSFGPSGLTAPPPGGVTIGYTCRLQSPERHKSIVRPDLLTHTLLNEVHHFHLREGFKYLNLPESTAIINHYKYQVWETFRAKFRRRVATYVVDWQENQNQGSKDRAPGLGTEAIEPPDWRLKFCEVWDTGLKDLILSNFQDPATGQLPWQIGPK